MKYFSNCATSEQVKIRFKELAKKLHPDCGGDAQEFKAMMQEYKIAFDRYKNIHESADGSTYEKESKENAEWFANIINQIVTMKEVTIEIIGSWIWITGKTYPYREQIKQAGFSWSKSKKAWYYTDHKYCSYHHHSTLEQIRNKFGSQIIEQEEMKAITA